MNLQFENYPDFKTTYGLSQGLKNIFNQDVIKDVARVKLAKWYNDVEASEFKAFNIAANSIRLNYNTILNYFNNRSTNASAESFNAKLNHYGKVHRFLNLTKVSSTEQYAIIT